MEGHKRKIILLVEDEALIAMAGKKALECFGYDVRVAKSGEDAVAILNSERKRVKQ